MNRLNKKKVVISGIGIITLLFCLFVLRNAIVHNNGKYETIKVRKGEVIQKVLATGTISPARTVRICSQVPGTIKEVSVDYNSFVQKGQLLARIDTREYDAELSRARANVAAAEALLEKEDGNCRQAESQLERTEVLTKGGAVPQSRYEEACAIVAAAQAQKKASVAQLDQAKAALRSASIRCDDARIISPIKGIILSKNAEVGQSISQSSLQESILFTIASCLSTMELKADVSESDIGKVAPGQEATFTVDAFPDTIFKGKVKVVRMEPIIDQKSVSYGVMVAIRNEDLLLRPSMTATIWIETARKTDVLLVPVSALIDSNGRSYVDVPGKKAQRKEVRTGLQGHDGFVEIIRGLSEGDDIILAAKAK